MRKFRSLLIWIPILVICLGLLYMPAGHKEEQVLRQWKSAPLGTPQLAVVPPTNWMDVGLKIGSLLGGIMTLLNIIEKIVRMVRKDVVRDSR